MKFSSYMFFNGTCEEAFKLYEQVLGGKIVAMTKHRGSFAEQATAPEWLDKILHARLIVGDQTLMGSDAPPQYYAKPQGAGTCISVDSTEEAERIYAALSEGGEINMPLEETPFAIRFAMFSDKYGTEWIVVHERPM